MGSIELSGGVMLDSVMLPHGGGGYEGEIGQFKLCVCMPSGTLFKVEHKSIFCVSSDSQT